jgi:hypothetical protein
MHFLFQLVLCRAFHGEKPFLNVLENGFAIRGSLREHFSERVHFWVGQQSKAPTSRYPPGSIRFADDMGVYSKYWEDQYTGSEDSRYPSVAVKINDMHSSYDSFQLATEKAFYETIRGSAIERFVGRSLSFAGIDPKNFLAIGPSSWIRLSDFYTLCQSGQRIDGRLLNTMQALEISANLIEMVGLLHHIGFRKNNLRSSDIRVLDPDNPEHSMTLSEFNVVTVGGSTKGDLQDLVDLIEGMFICADTNDTTRIPYAVTGFKSAIASLRNDEFIDYIHWVKQFLRYRSSISP